MEYVELSVADRDVLLRLCKAYCSNKDLSSNADAINVKRIGDKLFRVKT